MLKMTGNEQELPPFLSLEMSMLLIITVLCLFYQLLAKLLKDMCLIHFTNIFLKMVLSQNVSRGLGLNIHVKLL